MMNFRLNFFVIIWLAMLLFSCGSSNKEIQEIKIYYQSIDARSFSGTKVEDFDHWKYKRIIKDKDSIDGILLSLQKLERSKQKISDTDIFFRADFINEQGEITNQLTSDRGVFDYKGKYYYIDKELFELFFLEKDFLEIDIYYDQDFLDFLNNNN